MNRRLLAAALMMAVLSPVAMGQRDASTTSLTPGTPGTPGAAGAQTAGPTFDVVSIKPNTASAPFAPTDLVSRGRLSIQPGGRVVGTAVTAQQLIAVAYGLDRTRVVGLPTWAREDTFDIIATAARPSTVAEHQAMMQQLLRDRFQFLGHEDSRDQSVYRLVLVKADTLGPRLHISSDVCTPTIVDINAPRPDPPPSFNPNSPRKCSMGIRPGEIRAAGQSLFMFVQILQREVDRPLIDGTGLTGQYDFELRWRPASPGARQDDSFSRADSLSDETPILETALREQLGLKLQSDRAPGRVVVVDQIERPSPN